MAWKIGRKKRGQERKTKRKDVRERRKGRNKREGEAAHPQNFSKLGAYATIIREQEVIC